MKIRDVLVPTDFSPNSLRAIEFAVSLVEADGEICLLHVVDTEFVERLSEEGFTSAEAATTKLRESAEQRLQDIISAIPDPKPQLEPMIVIGRPFAEILRVADDLDFRLLVLGTRGRRGSDLEELLFGSTAEKVIRASRLPVICVPAGWTPQNAA